jgi:hypothetical protein
LISLELNKPAWYSLPIDHVNEDMKEKYLAFFYFKYL